MEKIETAISSCEAKISSCEAEILSCEAQIRRLLDRIGDCEESRREALVKELDYERTKASQLREDKRQLREEKRQLREDIVWIKQNDMQFSKQGFCSAYYWSKHRN